MLTTIAGGDMRPIVPVHNFSFTVIEVNTAVQRICGILLQRRTINNGGFAKDWT